MNRTQLNELAGNKQSALAYLQSNGLIRKRCECPICGRDMVVASQHNRASVFRCPKRCKPGGSKGLLADSFFARKKLTPEAILILLYGWAHNDSYRKILHESKRLTVVNTAKRNSGTPITSSSRTLCALGKQLTSLVRDHHLSLQERERIGGKNVIVQVDESRFGQSKGEKGRPIHERWVLGLIANDSTDFRTVVLADGKRDACILTTQICEHVKPGSVIVTDKWAGYITDTLKRKHYKHNSINHSDKKHPFVATDGTNTQRIESYWRDMKAKWKHHTIPDQYFEDWVYVYAWRRKCLQENRPVFEELLNIIRNRFPIPGNQ